MADVQIVDTNGRVPLYVDGRDPSVAVDLSGDSQGQAIISWPYAPQDDTLLRPMIKRPGKLSLTSIYYTVEDTVRSNTLLTLNTFINTFVLIKVLSVSKLLLKRHYSRCPFNTCC